MFKMPKDKEEFEQRKYPGNYAELLQKFPVGSAVTELEGYEVKHVAMLKGLTQDSPDGICTVVPAEGLSDPARTQPLNVGFALQHS